MFSLLTFSKALYRNHNNDLNKIAIRILYSRWQQGSHWHIKTILPFICGSRPSEVYSIFLLLAFIQSADHLFHSVIDLYDNEYFLICNVPSLILRYVS